MVQRQGNFSVPVVWRDKKLVLEINSEASLRELGEELQQLTDVKADTMRLIIPQTSAKNSKLFLPFSDKHSCLKLKDIGIVQGKPLRMMGALEREVDQLLKDAKANSRIAGFEDEEKRMKQRISTGTQFPLKLPEGPYTFCDFRTLELPGIKLNPPASEALKRMHMLAADPGIVAIMKKHHWRVGIMTEMAPEGRVGISPLCLLGFNKNHGEEISLRLRTDDLKGFRKYETIKKTLLHELAHMVYSEHDSNFYAFDRQLNKEAFDLDWTRSGGHTLSGAKFSGLDVNSEDIESESSVPHKLGGEASHMVAPARAVSVAAAHRRWVESLTDFDHISDETNENKEQLSSLKKKELVTENQHTDCPCDQHMVEPDPVIEDAVQMTHGPVDSEMTEVTLDYTGDGRFDRTNSQEEPVSVDSKSVQDEDNTNMRTGKEPDIEEFEKINEMKMEKVTNGTTFGVEFKGPADSETGGKIITPSTIDDSSRDQSQPGEHNLEPDSNVSQETKIGGPQSHKSHSPRIPTDMTQGPDPDDQKLKIIQDPVAALSNRLNDAIQKLNNDLRPSEASVVLQTLFRIMRNINKNPNEMKYKRFRKANPVFQRSIVNHKAAMEFLSLTGFGDDIVTDEYGKTESYLVLKRNDPALLWLAKSILDTYLGNH